MSENLGKKTVNGLFWMFGERIVAQLVSFIVSVILARLLLPKEYGIVSLVLVFINVANVFVTSGLGQSLIQDKNAVSLDYSTVFITNLVLSFVLYIILFLCSPFVALFYNNESLILLLRVISIKIPISAVSSVQRAYISKKMQFKKYFLSTLIGTVISGVVGVFMALNGFGVWSLCIQYLLNSIIDTVVLFITDDWRPRLKFSKQIMIKHLRFGIKLTLSSLINTVYLELQSLLIGKVYTESDLGFYKRGNQFPSLLVTNINAAVSGVMFPTFSKVSSDQKSLKSLMRRSMTITSYIITPIMFGMIAVARNIVLILLTDKWLPCVFYLQMACLIYMVLPIQTANCQAILAQGRSDVYLKMELVKKSFGIAILLYTLHKGVDAIAIGAAIAVLISAIISMIPNKVLMNYTFREQLTDLMPSYLISFIMIIPVMILNYIECNVFILLIMQVLIGITIYVGLSILFKVESLSYIVNFAKNYKVKRKE